MAHTRGSYPLHATKYFLINKLLADFQYTKLIHKIQKYFQCLLKEVLIRYIKLGMIHLSQRIYNL